MRRGDIILVREPNTPASKARPYVVITRDSALGDPTKVTGCPLTSRLGGVASGRPLVSPDRANGLRTPSEVQADWIFTHPVERVGGVIGQLDQAAMNAVDAAVKKWLSL